MTPEQIRALMRGIAPVVSDFVRAEIGKPNAKLTEEIAQLRAELGDALSLRLMNGSRRSKPNWTNRGAM
jgi:hypothetical protein